MQCVTLYMNNHLDLQINTIYKNPNFSRSLFAFVSIGIFAFIIKRKNFAIINNLLVELSKKLES